jgi:uncharacterized protein (TIGR02246 family)
MTPHFAALHTGYNILFKWTELHMLKKIIWLFSLTYFISLTAFADDTATIKNILTQQINQLSATWNAGDLDSFLTSYKNSGTTRYITSIETEGYQNIIAQYKKRFPTQEKMGKLSVSNLEINVLTPQYAMVIGKWKVTQKKKTVGGIFSLLYEKTSAGWKIIVDHTS